MIKKITEIKEDRNIIYVLVIRLNKNISFSTKKSNFSLERGTYIYIGSARKNLKSRLERHLSKSKRYHWHIDYLLRFAKIIKIYVSNTFKNECQTARNIEQVFRGKPIFNFGSTDCRCQSHLIKVKSNAILDRLQELVFKEWQRRGRNEYL